MNMKSSMRLFFLWSVITFTSAQIFPVDSREDVLEVTLWLHYHHRGKEVDMLERARDIALLSRVIKLLKKKIKFIRERANLGFEKTVADLLRDEERYKEELTKKHKDIQADHRNGAMSRAGWTYLHYAAFFNDTDLIRLLEENPTEKAILEIKTSKGILLSSLDDGDEALYYLPEGLTFKDILCLRSIDFSSSHVPVDSVASNKEQESSATTLVQNEMDEFLDASNLESVEIIDGDPDKKEWCSVITKPGNFVLKKK